MIVSTSQAMPTIGSRISPISTTIRIALMIAAM
jgi:hypothetical protein